MCPFPKPVSQQLKKLPSAMGARPGFSSSVPAMALWSLGGDNGHFLRSACEILGHQEDVAGLRLLPQAGLG